MCTVPVVRLLKLVMTLLTDHISPLILPSTFLCNVALYSQENCSAIFHRIIDGLKSTEDEETYAFMDDCSHGSQNMLEVWKWERFAGNAVAVKTKAYSKLVSASITPLI